MLEAIYQRLRPGRSENFFQGLVEKIAQHHIAIVVEAAGHEASIRQDAYLLDEGLAEKLLLFFFRRFNIAKVFPNLLIYNSLPIIYII